MTGSTAALVDEKQRTRLVSRFGKGARTWLAGLPAQVDALAAEWKLTVDGPAPHGRTSVVLRCRRADDAAAVLKVSPDRAMARSEARILRLWAGTGRVPQVWEVDEARGAILLESVGEGRTVALDARVPAMNEIGRLIADLHAAEIPASERAELHPLHERVSFLYDMWEHLRAGGPAAEQVPASLLHHGHARARALAADNGEGRVPLHGDLHPGNVLRGGPQRGLVAVDPRACIGDPAWDAAEWPLWRAESVAEVEHRAAELADVVGLPSERVVAWAEASAPILATGLANRGETASTPRFRTLMELAGR
ncbi:streptomycin 6-kinase [Murinocardiopsis flavida]|uniref:Streptomycin 6-kinase n=1 Tax=Murinocardiopsis flavida TaxID=645275 RepID=A0A2P8DJ56_9ACTN|nr:aminoglycoside phosphotransferase family protein [Murinocardiopsis flavida]PSK97199.1 streptomycin 6-kinase [Murinocardiopsis flavida]